MTTIGPLRLIQIIVAGLIALYLALLVFNNTIDYAANFSFMQQVAGMSDTYSTSNHWRSVTQSWIIHLFYGIIIVLQGLGAMLSGKGCWAMWQQRWAPRPSFSRAKSSALYGMLCGLLIWLGIFVAVGGEWFLMWQSSKWNAQETAFHLTEIFLLCLLLLLKKDEDDTSAI